MPVNPSASFFLIVIHRQWWKQCCVSTGFVAASNGLRARRKKAYFWRKPNEIETLSNYSEEEALRSSRLCGLAACPSRSARRRDGHTARPFAAAAQKKCNRSGSAV